MGSDAARGSAPHEVQRGQAAGQDDGADAAQLRFGQGLQLLGGALPAAGRDEQDQAFDHGDQAQGRPEILHGSGSLAGGVKNAAVGAKLRLPSAPSTREGRNASRTGGRKAGSRAPRTARALRQRSLRMYCRNGSSRSSTITPLPSAKAAR